MPLLRFYTPAKLNSIISAKIKNTKRVKQINIEYCYYVDAGESKELDVLQEQQLLWILQESFRSSPTRESHLTVTNPTMEILIEIGPRLNFSTPYSTNAVSICHSIGLTCVKRIEVSRRYLIEAENLDGAGDGSPVTSDLEQSLLDLLYDKMTECHYVEPLVTFDVDVSTDSVYDVDIMSEGKAALQKANTDLGLAFDKWDLEYYTNLFQEKVKRNPTSVECFDLAQSNSEHSRHWFFKGKMFIDGEEQKQSLFDLVISTQQTSNKNNIISFCDNSSAIVGADVKFLRPQKTDEPSIMEVSGAMRHIIFTAETHNFPTGVAPFPGATTGTGGRIRDVHAAGRGAHVVAGTAGYCFGNLNIPGYYLPWEDKTFTYPPNFASPLEIAIEASNGASDYGNKFGEPVLTGFARSFGVEVTPGDRREYIKPIMFSGGLGAMEDEFKTKSEPAVGMDVIKVGGPVYRIGVGGGAASSVQVQGDNCSQLDFGAVQRGDAEMEQKMNRVIRGCIEHQPHNPILSIHDQGAGGNGNVLKEICDPAGALIKASQFQLGDPSISILELWGAEYQENTAILVSRSDKQLMQKLATREKCPINFVGEITGDKKIRLEDDRFTSATESKQQNKKQKMNSLPVDLDLELVLGKMPQKEFHLSVEKLHLASLSLPQTMTVREGLDRVLRLPSVASKRYLTNKVDRSVTGLVAQQQCVGPLHTPLADVAVVALSHFTKVGSATAIGEQPMKGLVDPVCGARMTVAEALTNLVFAPITDLKDVKCSANWMWPAKLPGEGERLYRTCQAMCCVMQELGIAVDGGKDSLSMAARVGAETVKAPGTLVVSVYARCTNITATVTPDLKCPADKGVLLYVPLSGDHHRLGGSALAQCYNQIGQEAPNLDDSNLFINAFHITQSLITAGCIVSGHDVSDGGLATCILEMAFAGNCGVSVDITDNSGDSAVRVMFAEELGLVLEVEQSSSDYVLQRYSDRDVPCLVIGWSHTNTQVTISMNEELLVFDDVTILRDIWEETSFELEKFQTNPLCVAQERQNLLCATAPQYKLTFEPDKSEFLEALVSNVPLIKSISLPRVAIVREEGSNGDREMAAAFMMAGFETWDVNMQDLSSGAISLDIFQGLAFVGGFSYADVLGSAKGWAATLKFNSKIKAQFAGFYDRSDTFSLGVCNGCQLMGLLGIVAPLDVTETGDKQGVYFTHNLSERYESRFTSIRIEESGAIMLQGMAGSVLGIWVAHGEGNLVFRDDTVRDTLLSNRLAPIRYVSSDGQPTEKYPMNPNGSPSGIAALCSADGRHLAMMPHPERCVLPWQWAWMPPSWHKTMTTSPWLQMFTNAFNWCKADKQE